LLPILPAFKQKSPLLPGIMQYTATTFPRVILKLCGTFLPFSKGSQEDYKIGAFCNLFRFNKYLFEK
jgi:hypothetical protein